MNRRELCAAGIAGALAMAGGRAMAAENLAAKAEGTLRAWIDGWNADDLDAMFALFTPDAHWVNVVGMHWQGRAAVEQAHRAYFDLMFRGVKQRLLEIESLTPLPGGSVIVVSRIAIGAFRQPNGVVKPPSEDRLTLVMVPRGDGLAIAHGANIAIVPEAQQHDPMRRPG
jgi:uncharacterized protein (TIGR02246 family)